MTHTETSHTYVTPAALNGRVLAILRAADATSFPEMAAILIDSGICDLEVTLTTTGALDAVEAIRSNSDSNVSVGVGTVTHPDQVVDAYAAGARFVVSPHLDPDVVKAALARDMDVYPGALTPTEIVAAVRGGATAVKLFPAARMTVSYLRDLRGPFPDVPIIPTGGVTLDSVPHWLDAGALAVGIGSPLQGDFHKTYDEAALRSRAARALTSLDAR